MNPIARARKTNPLLIALFSRIGYVALAGGLLILLMVVACEQPFLDEKSIPEPPSAGEGIGPEKAPAPLVSGQSPVAQRTLMAWSTVPPASTPTSQDGEGLTPLPTTVAQGGEGGLPETVGAREGEATKPVLPSGAIGALSMPKSGISWPIFPVSWQLITVEGEQLGQWQWAATGIGYHLGTAWPGTRGNCVLSLGPEASEAAGWVAELAIGERIEALVGESRAVYTIVAVDKVRETGAPLAERRAHAAYMAPSEEARLTLIVCWPGWACTHRLVFVAQPQ